MVVSVSCNAPAPAAPPPLEVEDDGDIIRLSLQSFDFMSWFVCLLAAVPFAVLWLGFFWIEFDSLDTTDSSTVASRTSSRLCSFVRAFPNPRLRICRLDCHHRHRFIPSFSFVVI